MEHHAYIVEGSLSLLEDVAASARKKFGFTKEHLPDVRVHTFEKLGVEEAALLREEAALKSTSGKALFVVGFSLITSEAQQSLLKLLEEPQEGTVFVLLASHGSLLPTVRSRLLRFEKSLSRASGHNGNVLASDFSTRFLKASYKARTAQVAELLKEEGGERERARAFLQELEVVLHDRLAKSTNTKEIVEGLSDIAKVRSYVGDRSPSLKMLLEHLAVTLPTV